MYNKLLFNALLIIVFVVPCFSLQGQDFVTVFSAGKEGHASYRIPAIIGMSSGKLIAFAEGRVNHAGDFGDVNIVMKTSSDKGMTWSPLTTIVDYDKMQAGNAVPVVDLLDPNYPKGRIFLFYNTGNNHEYEVRKGKGLREVWYITSIDEGQSWSDPVNITTMVHRPNMPSVNPNYHFREDWRAYANGPGHGLQLENGKYRGRIYVPANHSFGPPQKNGMDYRAHGFYSDDHGKTFHISESVSLKGGNECSAAELPNDGLMLNIRNQSGTTKNRYVALSKDGGSTWYKEYFDKTLIDPVCQGSSLNLEEVFILECGPIAFCNAFDATLRNNLTVKISTDKGESWEVRIPIYNNPSVADAAAYSDMVNLDSYSLGVLFEKDGYSEIAFKKVIWREKDIDLRVD